jgi:hypothetical protein
MTLDKDKFILVDNVYNDLICHTHLSENKQVISVSFASVI